MLLLHMLFLRLLNESFRFAMTSLLENKLRTFLSLLGITIGIFAIISVFTVVDSIRRNLDDSLSSLGNNVVYIQKWPWEFSSEFPWWSYVNRPVTRYKELDVVRKQTVLAQDAAFTVQASATLQFGSFSAENVQITCVSDGWDRIKTFELGQGRYFTDAELKSGKNYVVLGAEVANLLFGNINPVGQTILIRGAKARVIGVFKREGQNIIDMGLDNAAVIPVNFARSLIDIQNDNVNPNILVKARPGVSNQALIDELTGVMRSVRRLSPREKDNFSLNETRLLSQGFNQLIGIVNIAGIFIGIFSILVGGFGIANIMFVSVKERTHIIGIQKAVGARNSFILYEFLFESVLLSVIGGAIGLLLIFILSMALSALLDFTIVLSIKNVLLGLGISSIIGLISGIAPALSASRLEPVDAMRSK